MKRISLLILDIVALYFSLYLTLNIRYGETLAGEINIHLIPFSIVFLFWITVFFISNLYDISYFKNEPRFYSRYFQTIAVSGALSIIFFYLIPFFLITPKTNLVIFIIIFTVIDIAIRSVYNRLISLQTFTNNTIIVGLDQQSLELAEYMNNNPQLGHDLKYIVDVGGKTSHLNTKGFKIIRRSEIDTIISKEKINTVILAPSAYNLDRVIGTFYKSLNKKINFFNLSGFYEKCTNRIPLGAINQAWFLDNLSEGTKKTYEIFKKGLDIIFAIIGGLIILLILPFIALAIKLDSAGPIFHKQKRVGQYRKIFTMYKFRTMINDAEKFTGAVWAKDNDPRVTRVGKLMRKTRLDEIPQIYNVLNGELALVGPRAERPEFDKELKKKISFYDERYLVRPGITGWAQINHYGASIKGSAEKLQYDLYYIKNRTLALDFSIILKTINIVLRFRGR